jgi:epoxyqueuosine reductase
MDLKAELLFEAKRLGFDEAGVAMAGLADEEGHFLRWLGAGHHGELTYLARRVAERRDPRVLLPGARTVVVLSTACWHERPEPGPGLRGKVARYAWGRDYHRVHKKRLRLLQKWLITRVKGARVYAEVDTGPVLEKVWAERAGLGWIGKNGNLVTRHRSSWCLLGAIVTDVELPPDRPHPNLCGRCERCLRACPTGAIVSAGVVDARLCLSSHNIERRGPIPENLRSRLGRWLFGCDDCQEVCPWNRFATEAGDPAFAPRPEQAHPDLREILALDEAAFRERFLGTPLLRAGRAGLARTAAVVLGNLGDPAAIPALARSLATDPSPVVRGHAAWGLGHIRSLEGRAILARAGATETDPTVREEIHRALAS